MADLSASIAVRKQGRTDAFSRDKLFLSLVASLGHRSSCLTDAGALCTTIISILLKNGSGALIETREIAKATQTVLLRFDRVGATHYAAYHAKSL